MATKSPKLIEVRTGGSLTFTLASLYATLYRLEERGWIKGRWVEKAGQRRRCYYRITDAGRKVLAGQREDWSRFVAALGQVAGVQVSRDWKALVHRHVPVTRATDSPQHTIDELAAHLEDIYADALAAGRSEAEAFRTAEAALAESAAALPRVPRPRTRTARGALRSTSRRRAQE